MHSSLFFNSGKDSSWINARRLQQHQKRLQEIRSRSVHATPTLRHSCKGLSYLEAERLHTIKRDNLILMKKLVTIAESKPDRSLTIGGHQRSMNLPPRRKDVSRIRHENETLASRLSRIESGSKKTITAGRHHHSNSYVLHNSSKTLLKLTAMVAADSDTPLNSTVVEESKYKKSRNLNRSWAELHKAPGGVTLAQYFDAKGTIAVISDLKRVKKKGKALELFSDHSKLKLERKVSSSVRKLEIVRLPGYECKSVTHKSSPVTTPPRPPPALLDSRQPSPAPSDSSKKSSSLLRRLITITTPQLTPTVTPTVTESAPISEEVSKVNSQEKRESEYSEDQHHEDSEEYSLESSHSDDSQKQKKEEKIVLEDTKNIENSVSKEEKRENSEEEEKEKEKTVKSPVLEEEKDVKRTIFTYETFEDGVISASEKKKTIEVMISPPVEEVDPMDPVDALESDRKAAQFGPLEAENQVLIPPVKDEESGYMASEAVVPCTEDIPVNEAIRPPFICLNKQKSLSPRHLTRQRSTEVDGSLIRSRTASHWNVPASFPVQATELIPGNAFFS